MGKCRGGFTIEKKKNLDFLGVKSRGCRKKPGGVRGAAGRGRGFGVEKYDEKGRSSKNWGLHDDKGQNKKVEHHFRWSTSLGTGRQR